MDRQRLVLMFFTALLAAVSGCKQDVSTNDPGNVEATVVRTEADYDPVSFRNSFPDTIAFATITAEFRREYSEERRSRLIEKMLTQVLSLGEDVSLMRTILERAGCMEKGYCIAPTYAERAKYGGREAWIIQFTWGMRYDDFGHYKRLVASVPELDTLYYERCK